MNWDEMAVVGRIARAHGHRGHVIVNLETDFPEARFRPGARLFIQRAGRVEAVELMSVRFQRERPIIGIDGVGSMDEAEVLAGCELRVPIEQLTPLPEGTFYHHDLIGCRLETRDGRIVGTVHDVESGSGASRLVVEASCGEILVPFVAVICTMIDPAHKRIVIDPPQGLLELNAPTRPVERTTRKGEA